MNTNNVKQEKTVSRSEPILESPSDDEERIRTQDVIDRIDYCMREITTDNPKYHIEKYSTLYIISTNETVYSKQLKLLVNEFQYCLLCSRYMPNQPTEIEIID